MFSRRWQLVRLLAVIIFLCNPTIGFGQKSQAQSPVATAVPDAELAALAEVPSGQVIVTYENAELTIKSRSATLSEVLRAVCGQIGADLDARPRRMKRSWGDWSRTSQRSPRLYAEWVAIRTGDLRIGRESRRPRTRRCFSEVKGNR